MTMAFSVVMWSRLHLIMPNSKYLRWVLYMIIFTTLCISIPSMVIGPMSVRPPYICVIQHFLTTKQQQPTPAGKRLVPLYNIWSKIENATWPIQESIISLLYIWYTHKNLGITSRSRDTLSHTSQRSALSFSYSAKGYSESFTQLMHHLIATNILIIVLDIALLAIVYAEMWYINGNMKPAVYGIKLRIEFSILNRLVSMTHTGRNRVGRDSPDSGAAAPLSFITKAPVATDSRAEES